MRRRRSLFIIFIGSLTVWSLSGGWLVKAQEALVYRAQSPAITQVQNTEPVTKTITLQLSEVMSCPATGEKEWLEIYVTGESDWLMDNWRVKNSKGTSRIIRDLTIKANQLNVIELSSAILANAGDTAILENEAGEVILQAELGSCELKNSSWVYDGENWRETAQVSKGEANPVVSSGKQEEILTVEGAESLKSDFSADITESNDLESISGLNPTQTDQVAAELAGEQPVINWRKPNLQPTLESSLTTPTAILATSAGAISRGELTPETQHKSSWAVKSGIILGFGLMISSLIALTIQIRRQEKNKAQETKQESTDPEAEFEELFESPATTPADDQSPTDHHQPLPTFQFSTLAEAL